VTLGSEVMHLRCGRLFRYYYKFATECTEPVKKLKISSANI